MTLHIAEEERAGGRAEVRQLSVLRGVLAELIVQGVHLREAKLFGSYDVLRSAIATISRQYTDFEEEIDG